CHTARSGASLGKMGDWVDRGDHRRRSRSHSQSWRYATQRCICRRAGPADDLDTAFLCGLFPACPERASSGQHQPRSVADHDGTVVGSRRRPDTACQL
ncbi:uncharacterized protein METZ01_LOCUS255396, partial [marine metagenome]